VRNIFLYFEGEDFIKPIRDIKDGAVHIICALKSDKGNYEYQGEKVNFKGLIAKLKKEKIQSRCRRCYSSGAEDKD
jgi:hypothetical protein